MILLFLCIGSLLFLYVLFVFFIFCGKNRHTFWNNQSVSHGTIDNEKVISSNPVMEKLSNEVTLLDHTDDKIVKEVSEFLKRNYIENSNVGHGYLKWYFSYPCKHKFLFGIRNDDGKIIGTIYGYSIVLIIRGKRVNVLHVDLLCVDKINRNKRNAPKLITSMMNAYKEIGYDTCIFSKDTNPLPFNHIAKLWWKSYEGEGAGEIIEKEENKKKAYEIFVADVSKNDIYQEFSFEEFDYYFKNYVFIDNALYIYSEYDNDIIKVVYVIGNDESTDKKFAKGFKLIYYLNNINLNYKSNTHQHMYYHLYNYDCKEVEKFGFITV